MDIEKLYQDVWARVFSAAWPEGSAVEAALDANAAAEDAVRLWDPAKATAVIAEKAKQS